MQPIQYTHPPPPLQLQKALVDRDRAAVEQPNKSVRLLVRDMDTVDGTLRMMCDVVAGLTWADVDPSRPAGVVEQVLLVWNNKWLDNPVNVERGMELRLHHPWECMVIHRLPVLMGLTVSVVA